MELIDEWKDYYIISIFKRFFDYFDTSLDVRYLAFCTKVMETTHKQRALQEDLTDFATPL